MWTSKGENGWSDGDWRVKIPLAWRPNAVEKSVLQQTRDAVYNCTKTRGYSLIAGKDGRIADGTWHIKLTYVPDGDAKPVMEGRGYTEDGAWKDLLLRILPAGLSWERLCLETSMSDWTGEDSLMEGSGSLSRCAQ